jgi:hypothetical protein
MPDISVRHRQGLWPFGRGKKHASAHHRGPGKTGFRSNQPQRQDRARHSQRRLCSCGTTLDRTRYAATGLVPAPERARERWLRHPAPQQGAPRGTG